MKVLKYILTLTTIIILATACNEGNLDPITKVEPGSDQTVPVITIISPVAGIIDIMELVVPVNIKFQVTDDIELGTITVMLNNNQIASYQGADFRDYRRFLMDTLSTRVTTGSYVLSVKATDLQGKTTTQSVNFTKLPPYTPKYSGEIFYMPFDKNYIEHVTFTEPTVVGTPGFAGAGLKGLNAYQGATGSYLTFPTSGMKGSELSAAFWYKVNGSPDRSGILNASPSGENRSNGFRLFREGGTKTQQIKLNVGTGTGETWNNGGEIAVTGTKWVHIAFTISSSKSAIYINGLLAREEVNSGLDWTGCDALSIGSGAPNFSYWGHGADLSQYDELRIFNKALTQEEIQTIIQDDSPFVPRDGEIFYMPFEGNYKETISKKDATITGAPGFADGKIGKAYSGATDSYLTFPAGDLTKTTNFSASFWMKINAVPDRAGILIMGPPDIAAPTAQNNRNSGFRFFREAAGTKQRFKLNAGNGTVDTWFDGGSSADVDPTTGNWVHFAFTISGTEGVVYINGEVVKQGSFANLNWTGCDILTIMSGVPRFTGWSHFSDLSLMDELHLFNKALTLAEVLDIYNTEK